MPDPQARGTDKLGGGKKSWGFNPSTPPATQIQFTPILCGSVRRDGRTVIGLDGMRSLVGEIKETAQSMLTAHANTSTFYRYMHVVVLVWVEHWAS